ncbi:MAG: TonB-dependent receptor [Alphaproteobacteria bacterium]|nr:TonB-dependent receptor [Alphaproteobacteria bacterium]MDE2112585.1 TonB-dependent receptor [Alphaproteobacteria bacterium]
MLKRILLLGTAFVLPISSAYADETVETVVVLGKGETRQVESISQNEIQDATPGTSAIKVISKLPGVNYQAADPFGAYEWAVRISVRGFNQNQLGFTLDDVPLGDMSYGNDNGLHISRAISSENIGAVVLAQGTGALGTASTSNLGGTLEFHSSAPKDRFGVLAASSYGSDSTLHEFVRVDSGLLPGGGSGYVSGSYQYADKWKGKGVQKQLQVNSKFVQPVGPVTLTGFFNYSARRENDYQDLSLSLIKRAGYTWDNITGHWAEAVAIANTYQANPGGDCPQVGGGNGSNVYPAPVQCVDDAYYNASGLRNDALGGVTADWSILDNLSLHVTAYGHNNKGMGTWDTPYVPTPGGAPISIRTTEYGINRYGTVATLTWTVGSHTIEGGYWYENNNFHQARRYYGLDATGTNRNNLEFQTNPFFTQWEYRFNTVTSVFHLQDTWQITDALKLNYGFKTQKVNNSAHGLTGSAFSGKIGTDNNFLPQAGVNYAIDGNNEVFADYSKNQRAFVAAATTGPFSTTQAGFNAIAGKLKPETSQTFEGGYRYNGGSFQGLLAGYFVKFKNRLLATTVGSGIVGNPSALSNVGSVTSEGIEAAGTWRFFSNMWLFGSYAYDASTYDDNTYDGSGNLVALTKDKTTVDAPKHMLKGQLGYDDGSIFGQIDGSYMSKRFYTYTNDASVPSQTVFDLTLGYRFHGNDLINGLELQGNVTNLFDAKYISTIGTNGFVNSDPGGNFQTLMVGPQRQFFITARKQF